MTEVAVPDNSDNSQSVQIVCAWCSYQIIDGEVSTKQADGEDTMQMKVTHTICQACINRHF